MREAFSRTHLLSQEDYLELIKQTFLGMEGEIRFLRPTLPCPCCHVQYPDTVIQCPECSYHEQEFGLT